MRKRGPRPGGVPQPPSDTPHTAAFFLDPPCLSRGYQLVFVSKTPWLFALLDHDLVGQVPSRAGQIPLLASWDGCSETMNPWLMGRVCLNGGCGEQHVPLT